MVRDGSNKKSNSVPSRTTPVTPDDAREIVERFISSHFDKPRPAEKARFSIPAEPNRDDDFALERFIAQYEALLRAALEEVELYRRRDMMPQAEMLVRFKMIDELKIEALLAAGVMQENEREQ